MKLYKLTAIYGNLRCICFNENVEYSLRFSPNGSIHTKSPIAQVTALWRRVATGIWVVTGSGNGLLPDGNTNPISLNTSVGLMSRLVEILATTIGRFGTLGKKRSTCFHNACRFQNFQVQSEVFTNLVQIKWGQSDLKWRGTIILKWGIHR